MVTFGLGYGSGERFRVPDVGDDPLNLTRPSGRDSLQIGGMRHRIWHTVHVGATVDGYHSPTRTGQAVDDCSTDAARSTGHDRHTSVGGALRRHDNTVRRSSQSRP